MGLLSFALEHGFLSDGYRRRLTHAAAPSNARIAIRISAPFDPHSLQRAADATVARHDILRTAFTRKSDIAEAEYADRITQFGVYGAVSRSLHTADVKPALSASVLCAAGFASAADADARIYEQYAAPFDYAAPPHLRVIAIPSASEHLVVLIAPELVCDRASAAILAQDFVASYATSTGGSEEANRFATLASTEHQEYSNGTYASSIADWRTVWRDYMDTQIRPNECPLSWPGPLTARFGASRTDFSDALMAQDESRLLWRAFESDALKSLAVAALASTVQEFTVKQRFPIWVEMDGRNPKEAARTVGPLASAHMLGVTLPLGSGPKVILDQVKARLEDIATRPQILYPLLLHANGRSFERGIRFSARIEHDLCVASEPGPLSDLAEEVPLRWPLMTAIACDTRVRLTRSGAVVSVAYSTALFTSPMIQKWLDAYCRHLVRLTAYVG